MGHRDRRARRRRLSREESRRALLDEGRRMADEQPVGPGLDHIHPATAASNLGLTTGAVYHHWESYDDFRDELLEELLSADRFPAVAGFDEAFVEELGSMDDIGRVILSVTDTAWREVVGDHRQLRTNLGLWARGEDEITERLAAQYRHLAKSWATVIEGGLREYDLEPRPPFTMDLIASVLAALVEGLAVQVTTEPDRDWSVADAAGEHHSLFSVSAAAFLASAVRPVGQDATLWAHLSDTIGSTRPTPEGGDDA